MTEKKTYSVEEAARVIGWSRVKAYEAVKQGVLPAIRFGRRIVVPVAALDRWLETAGAGGAQMA
jgi:excisionase family DNA binding protein